MAINVEHLRTFAQTELSPKRLGADLWRGVQRIARSITPEPVFDVIYAHTPPKKIAEPEFQKFNLSPYNTLLSHGPGIPTELLDAELTAVKAEIVRIQEMIKTPQSTPAPLLNNEVFVGTETSRMGPNFLPGFFDVIAHHTDPNKIMIGMATLAIMNDQLLEKGLPGVGEDPNQDQMMAKGFHAGVLSLTPEVVTTTANLEARFQVLAKTFQRSSIYWKTTLEEKGYL